MIWRTTMDNLLEALAKSLNVSIDGISELLGSIKDSTPQLYEQLVREWTYYTVLSKASMSMVIISILIVSAGLFIYKNCIVDYIWLDSRDIHSDISRYDYAKRLTRENIHNNMNTFKKLAIIVIIFLVCATVFHIGKYILAPNYSFLLNEILPRLVNK